MLLIYYLLVYWSALLKLYRYNIWISSQRNKSHWRRKKNY